MGALNKCDVQKGTKTTPPKAPYVPFYRMITILGEIHIRNAITVKNLLIGIETFLQFPKNLKT